MPNPITVAPTTPKDTALKFLTVKLFINLLRLSQVKQNHEGRCRTFNPGQPA
jgi:hypothetical protein